MKMVIYGLRDDNILNARHHLSSSAKPTLNLKHRAQLSYM